MAAGRDLGGGKPPHPHGHPKTNPIEIVVRAIAEVLHPHAEHLRLDPLVTARLLAGVVIASTRPLGSGLTPPLTPDQIVELFLDGALVRSSSVEDPC